MVVGGEVYFPYRHMTFFGDRDIGNLPYIDNVLVGQMRGGIIRNANQVNRRPGHLNFYIIVGRFAKLNATP